MSKTLGSGNVFVLVQMQVWFVSGLITSCSESNPYPSFSGYSDIALINVGDIAVLFETGPNYIKQLRYEGIGFKILKFTDIEGNKLLKMEDLVGDQRESWKLEWNIADPNTGVTVVFRSKPTEILIQWSLMMIFG